MKYLYILLYEKDDKPYKGGGSSTMPKFRVYETKEKAQRYAPTGVKVVRYAPAEIQ